MLRTVPALLLSLALAGCASDAADGRPRTTQEASMRTIAAGTSISMPQGETVRLPDGATLKYVSVPQDSRCPPDAQCIRAGDADILFEFAAGGGPVTPVQPNLPEAPSKSVGAWQLTVEALGFGMTPPVTVRIDPAS